VIWLAQKKDLEQIDVLCRQFSEASHFVKYKPDVFRRTWESLIDSGFGVLLVQDDFHGMLGAMAYPDPNSGETIATEMFWWVDPQHRGKGQELLSAYEQWASAVGATKAIMVHLSDSMPERLKMLYKRKGYSEMETHYVKDL
jgi:GNAT superfamily N-acetyltransferase